MRAKQLRLIVTFHTTTSAMALEKICAARHIPGRLIPVPADIKAGCGMAWCAPTEAGDAIAAAAEESGIIPEGWHELMA